MITLTCDKKDCDRRIWFRSYWTERKVGETSDVQILVRDTPTEELIRKTFPGNGYINSEIYMLCDVHTKEWEKIRVENQKDIDKQKLEWIGAMSQNGAEK